MVFMIKLSHWRASFDDIVCSGMIADFDSGWQADDSPFIDVKFAASPSAAAACDGLPLAALRDILVVTLRKSFLAIRLFAFPGK